MRCHVQRFRLTKSVPLAISRGTTSSVTHLLVQLEHDGLVGIGETGEFEIGHRKFRCDAIAEELADLLPHLKGLDPGYLRPSNPC